MTALELAQELDLGLACKLSPEFNHLSFLVYTILHFGGLSSTCNLTFPNLRLIPTSSIFHTLSLFILFTPLLSHYCSLHFSRYLFTPSLLLLSY
jgi:hypothetical protein